MRLLTAWTGTAADDFSWTIPGELVEPVEVCTRDELGEGDCGCSRSFVGLASGKATTTAIVAELDIDEPTLTAIVRDAYATIGWAADEQDIAATTAGLVELGERWPTGTVVRRDRDHVEAA